MVWWKICCLVFILLKMEAKKGSDVENIDLYYVFWKERKFIWRLKWERLFWYDFKSPNQILSSCIHDSSYHFFTYWYHWLPYQHCDQYTQKSFQLITKSSLPITTSLMFSAIFNQNQISATPFPINTDICSLWFPLWLYTVLIATNLIKKWHAKKSS